MRQFGVARALNVCNDIMFSPRRRSTWIRLAIAQRPQSWRARLRLRRSSDCARASSARISTRTEAISVVRRWAADIRAGLHLRSCVDKVKAQGVIDIEERLCASPLGAEAPRRARAGRREAAELRPQALPGTPCAGEASVFLRAPRSCNERGSLPRRDFWAIKKNIKDGPKDA